MMPKGRKISFATVLKMLKHVHISPLRSRSDSISRSSTMSSLNSSSCTISLRGSPEPHLTPSRSSSYTSLNESIAQATLKVYTACLKLDIEYKTLAVSWDTTARQIVTQVLRRCKMRHRDPRLFYLSMEVRIRRADARTMLVLDDSARPAMLQACHPSGESKFHLQMKQGGLIRVHTSALQQTSQYKSLLISDQTTSDELLTLLLSCYNLNEPVEDYSLYEVCPDQEYQRKLHPDDLPLRAQILRNPKGENCHFLVRKIRNMARRSLQLDQNQTNNAEQMIMKPIEASLVKSTFTKFESCFGKLRRDESDENGNLLASRKCQCSSSNCNYNHQSPLTVSTASYSPVYNIREIRTVQNSFSTFGSDKKLIDLERATRRHSVAVDELLNSRLPRRIGNFVYV
ncbi:hypothetical protein PVAND_004752 [Polypedilum vanderplanki]|uniref:Ras-associating domain-containing protein n=1 Tax=Polypedilum vanderplanki TaxID=319348 RepID=A0A9J6BY42_POLVA|nr:hypothetical protein PVAND_004752 [Polypedilum vanderplanki]